MAITEEENNRSCRMLLELFNEEIFGALPKYLTDVIAAGPASMVIRESMRQATRTTLKHESRLKEWISTANSMEEIFNICYTVYEELGYSFSHSVEFENEDKTAIKVTECSHIEHTKNNSVACSACEGIILGILEEEFNIHLPKIHYEKCMARGDEFCRYTVPTRIS